jgi:hypothetical protein
MRETEKFFWYRFIDNQSLLGFVGSLIVLGSFYFSGEIEPFGIWPGLIIGILAGVAIIMIWRNLAKKGRFVLGKTKDSFRFRLWHFGIFILIGFFIGIMINKLLEQYPEIDMKTLLATSFIFGCLGLFGIGTLGIFWIQRKYGERFYLSGRNGDSYGRNGDSYRLFL